MTTIITSVGYPGAGKSELADFLENHGINRISMGNVLRDKFEEARQDGLVEEQVDGYEHKNKSDLLGDWATKQREIHGADIVAQWTTKYIKDNIGSDTVFVDGLRSPDELSVFQDNFDSVNVIYVHANKTTRLERLQERDRDGEGSFTMRDLEERDSREEEWGMKNIKPHTDYSIDNEGSLEEFRNKIQDLLDNIL